MFYLKQLRQKDDILSYLLDVGTTDSEEFAQVLKIKHYKAVKLLNVMEADGYLILDRFPQSILHLASITDKGKTFFFTGGYEAHSKAKIKSSFGKYLLQILTVMFSVTTIYISIIQIRLSDKTKHLEERNEKLQKQIDSIIKNPVKNVERIK